ncbi:hypothetical protein G3N94_08180 [Burkholderia sp. Ac-20353]|nr:hypothetical protein [Burkholderia sp. Ac-20353]
MVGPHSEPLDVGDRVRNAFGASCSRLRPISPVMLRCAYFPVNFFAYAAGIRMRRAVGIDLARDRRDIYRRRSREALLQHIELRFAAHETEAPAIAVYGDRDVVDALPRLRGALDLYLKVTQVERKGQIPLALAGIASAEGAR